MFGCLVCIRAETLVLLELLVVIFNEGFSVKLVRKIVSREVNSLLKSFTESDLN